MLVVAIGKGREPEGRSRRPKGKKRVRAVALRRGRLKECNRGWARRCVKGVEAHVLRSTGDDTGVTKGIGRDPCTLPVSTLLLG